MQQSGWTGKHLACLLLIALLGLSGCASHSNRLEQARLLTEQGNYEAAAVQFEKQLGDQRNRLLRMQELGVLYHLQGRYQDSLEQLEQADRLAEEFYTLRSRDMMQRVATNASMTTYRGTLVERVYIHYYKLLNYFALAETSSGEERLRLLDSARVEGRRVMILLDENLIQQGSYEQAANDRERTLSRLQGIFAALNGSVINPAELVFRDNAFAHYLIGTLFEALNEQDSARISYERAARTYEQGYTRQYLLSNDMAAQAWLDALRIRKAQRDGNWTTLADQKLDAARRAQLNAWQPWQQGELLVVQEVELNAPRGELNLWVLVQNNRMFIRPVLTGSAQDQAYQLAWFHYLYSSRGSLLAVVERIHADDYIGLLTQSVEQVIPLPPALRNLLDSMGLLNILTSTGLRLSVPLFHYDDPAIQASQLLVDGKLQGSLLIADNLAGLVMAQHLVDARSELTDAMAIEALRLSMCAQTGLPPALCALAAASTATADTRAWLTLPNQIRIHRQSLAPGRYDVTLQSTTRTGATLSQSQPVELAAGDVKVVRFRSFAATASQGAMPVVVQATRQD